MSRFAKFWGALVAGALVVLGSGLITGDLRVWISTAITAGGAALAAYGIRNAAPAAHRAATKRPAAKRPASTHPAGTSKPPAAP